MLGKEDQGLRSAGGFFAARSLSCARLNGFLRRQARSRWWMYLAGRATKRESIELFSASLPPGAPRRNRMDTDCMQNDKTKIADLAGHQNSQVMGSQRRTSLSVLRQGLGPASAPKSSESYYAGGAANVWGPYTIGYLEWNGTKWVDQSTPAFVANEEWEHGSVYEPNLIYHDGKWKMWYVAGSNQEDYLVQGYSESVDGRTNWTKHQIVFRPRKKRFSISA